MCKLLLGFQSYTFMTFSKIKEIKERKKERVILNDKIYNKKYNFYIHRLYINWLIQAQINKIESHK